MNDQTDIPKFVSIKTFWKDMLGVGSKTWFYDHLKDEHFPQPVDVGGRKMLVLSEVVDYMEHLKSKRLPEKPKPATVKRRVGRPASMPKHLRQ